MRPHTFARALATVSGLTGLSRALGFVRDQMFAAVIGPGLLLDAWFAAFTLPNVFRRTFAEGAMSAAYVPLLKGKLEADGPEAAQAFARAAFTLLMLILVPLVALLIGIMPWIVQFVIGYAPGETEYVAALAFGRIMIPYLLFMSAMALIGGTLDALGTFWPKALAPAMLNVILVILLGFISWTGASDPSYFSDALSLRDREEGRLLAWGTFVAGLAQLAVVWIPAARLGWAPRLAVPRGTGAFLARMVPGVIANGGFQISSLVVLALAASQAGDLSHLRFADRLYQLPLGLVGIALNTILISTLSGLVAQGDVGSATRQVNRALEFSLLLSIPIAFACFFHAEFLFQGLFEYGNFTAEDRQGAGLALVGYAVGIPAAVGQKVLQPAFFARQNTRIPMIHSLASVAVAVALSYALYPSLGIFGLALAASISFWTGFISLALHLALNRYFTPDRRLGVRLIPMLAAAGLMTLALSGLLALFSGFGGLGFALRLPATVLIIASSAAVYFLALLAFGGLRLADLISLFRRT